MLKSPFFDFFDSLSIYL